MQNLVIVESPTKAKTISKFLGKNYDVKSSFGHIRDLPQKEMGIDINDHFTPTYVIEGAEKKKTAEELKKAAKKSDKIYFATDEDREGEAIAWHLSEILKTKKDKIKRITFHEITKEAIEKSIKHPRVIDTNRVNAQQARRILDRLVGYELSPFLWKKVAKGLSAGRVQSVAVRLLVEREREISQFDKKEYWTIDAIFTTHDPSGNEFDLKNLPKGYFVAKLFAINGKSLGKFEISDEKHAKELLGDLTGAKYFISKIEKKETKKSPQPPLITSTLQQSANSKFGFSAKQTMRVAQQLYEQGYITYMRTDSLALSSKFLKEAKYYISSKIGENYSLKNPRVFKSKAKTAQEAHEAIRPTQTSADPNSLTRKLDKNQKKIYELIWRRAVASQMQDAILDNVSVDINAKTDAEYVFRASGQTIKFDGFLKISRSSLKEEILPELEKGQKVKAARILPNQHFTEPPPRYSDASLVKSLEEYEIGRPSTYAPTISTIIERGYAERIEGRRLKPTDMAFLVNDILVEHFPKITDYTFTARMEEELDEIANGKVEWEKSISDFYHPFKQNLMEKTQTLSKKDLTEEKTDQLCEKCGRPMIIKTGRFGRFFACSGFPECKNTKQIGKDGQMKQTEKTNEKCPECGGPMEVKHGRFGKFLGCLKYPECKGIKKMEKSTGVACPECKKGEIAQKKSKKGKIFYACNRYPECKTAFFAKPTGEKCAECGSLMISDANGSSRCSNKDCGFRKKT